MINVKKFCFNPMQTNCYVVNDENHAIIIDPCCYFDYEKQELDDYITSNNLKIEHILVTHMHADHILGLNWCQNKYGVIAEGPGNENHWIDINKNQAKQMGYNIDNDISPITKSISDKFFLNLEKNKSSYIQILHTPGHSPGHLSYAVFDIRCSTSIALFCGDVVFKNGIGRYDFPDSNYEDLQKSIETIEKTPTYQIYPGHGESFSFNCLNYEEEKPIHDQKKSFWKRLFGN